MLADSVPLIGRNVAVGNVNTDVGIEDELDATTVYCLEGKKRRSHKCTAQAIC